MVGCLIEVREPDVNEIAGGFPLSVPVFFGGFVSLWGFGWIGFVHGDCILLMLPICARFNGNVLELNFSYYRSSLNRFRGDGLYYELSLGI